VRKGKAAPARLCAGGKFCRAEVATYLPVAAGKFS